MKRHRDPGRAQPVPQEIEEAVGEVAGVRKGCVAVFGRRDEKSGTERLVVMAETKAPDGRDAASVRAPWRSR